MGDNPTGPVVPGGAPADPMAPQAPADPTVQTPPVDQPAGGAPQPWTPPTETPAAPMPTGEQPVQNPPAEMPGGAPVNPTGDNNPTGTPPVA